MAIALIFSGGAGSASSSTTTTVTGFGATIPAGTLITLGWSGNSSSVSSVADNSVQAGAANSYTVRPQQLGTGGSRITTIWCVTTRPILAANTITITHPVSVSRRAARVYCWSGVAATSPLDQTATAGSAASPLTVGPTGVLAATGELAINMVGWIGGVAVSGAADTSGFTLATTNSGGASTNVEVIAAYKLGVGTAAVSDSMTFTSLTAVRGELLTFKQAAGTSYAQSVSGAVSFAGTRPVVAMQRKTLGSATFAGVVASHPTGRLVTGGFAPTGVVASQATMFRTLTGALAFSGARTAATAYARSLVGAVFAPTGAQTRVKAVSKALSGALSFAGVVTWLPQKLLTAVLAPVGVVSRALVLLRSVAGSLAFGGAVKRLTSRKLTGVEAPTGFIVVSIPTTHFFGALRPTGTVSNQLATRALFAGFAATGNLVRRTSRFVASSLVASGLVNTQYLPPAPAPTPGGGGFGALMSDEFFTRYQVDAKWRGVKRVKA